MIRSLIFALPFTIAAADEKPPPLDAGSYNQWKDALKSTTATPAGEVRALPGFRVELVRSAQAEEGSWVALSFDGKGRPIISREDKGLLRLTLPAKSGDPVPAELVEDTLLEVRGLLCEGDAIIANANNSRTLVKLRDVDGDGKYEERTVLMETPGGVGHGRNQIARDPGGALWVMGGDDVKPPAVFDAVFRNYGNDRMFTAAWDQFHWSNSVQPPCGHVIQLAGGKPMLYCGGLRNPFGIAFNEDGEAFTYDADMEWDIGLPWYRPTRVIHLVSGADYGWRGASRPIPSWMPDTWPAVCDIGRGSPTSIMFGTRSKFPRPWRDALFIMDWAYGIIHAVHLTPKGSTYEGRSEVFLQGRPLNVTGLDFGPDGAMYFVTGGRRTQSGLYRVTWTGELPAPEVKPPDAAAIAAAKLAREQRHKLELLHRDANDPAWAADIESGLGSDDPFLRKAARVALEFLLVPPSSPDILKNEKLHIYVAEWRARVDRALALALTLPSAGAAEVLLAVARVAGAEFQPSFHVFFGMITRRDWDDAPENVRATQLRTLQISLLRQGQPTAGQAASLVAFLNGVVPYGQPMADRIGAELLVYLQSPWAIGKFLGRVEIAATQEERLHYLFTLRHAKTGWTLDQRKAWIAAFRRESSRAVGAHHLGVTFRYARAEFEATLTAEEKAALAADLVTLNPAAVAVPAVAPRPFVKAWTQAELERHLPAVAAKERDLKRGRELFKSQCAACHRYGSEGGVIGPDLTGIAGRFDRRTILESLLDPWRVVADPYRFATATLNSGEIVSGRVLGDDGTTLSLEVNPIEPGAARKVPRGEASTIAFSSQMLPGLANSFSQEELLDLLAFMERGDR